MQMAMAVLECHSRSKALDWSLVLISQGVENTPGRREEDGAWVLEIAEADLSRAQDSIAAYEHENAKVWRHELKWTGLLFDVSSVLWFAGLAFFYFTAGSRIDFKMAGMVDRMAIWQGEWWRLFTAVTLHADVAHLAANITTGIIFLGLAMGCFRPGVALLLSFLGGALGNLATIILHDGAFRSLGASGMVMASLGLITAHSLSFSHGEKRAIWIGRSVVAGCLLVVLLGLSPGSDVIAHLGGFVAGLVLGAASLRYRSLLARTWLNASAVFLCAALVVLTWLLALHH
jgi:membrane associated rhomboid family serine protease